MAKSWMPGKLHNQVNGESAALALSSAGIFVTPDFLMVPIRKPKVALQHPSWGDRVRPTPGAEGTALLLVGQKPTSRRSARSHPARMTRMRASQSTTLHIQNVQRRAGFGSRQAPANQRLDRFSLLVGQTKRDAILACAEPLVLLSGRPFTLTHIHEVCTEFNDESGIASQFLSTPELFEQGTIGPSQTKMKVRTALEPAMSETVRDRTGRRDQHD